MLIDSCRFLYYNTFVMRHSLVDKTLASGAEDAGSIPVGRTIH